MPGQQTLICRSCGNTGRMMTGEYCVCPAGERLHADIENAPALAKLKEQMNELVRQASAVVEDEKQPQCAYCGQTFTSPDQYDSRVTPRGHTVFHCRDMAACLERRITLPADAEVIEVVHQADETPAPTFAALVAAYRAVRGWTLIELGCRAGVSAQYLNDIEHGRRVTTSIGVAERLSSALGIPLDVVYFRQGRIPPDIAGADVPEWKVAQAVKQMRETVMGVSHE